MTQPLLDVEHLSMRFGGLLAVNDASFTAHDKQITAVIGPNGSIARTLRTGSDDRVANMRAFAAEALKLLNEQLN